MIVGWLLLRYSMAWSRTGGWCRGGICRRWG